MISRRSVEATEQKLDGRTLAGYAAVYGQDSREIVEGGRKFTERIAPGAFNETLASGADVKLYYNHDASMPLARTKSGTLTLDSRADGLHYTATLPETTLGNDVRTLLERGDLTGEMSFGFYVERDTWNAKRTERRIESARLVEISLVQDPAYDLTSSSLRCVNAAFTDAVAARLELHIRRLKLWNT